MKQTDTVGDKLQMLTTMGKQKCFRGWTAPTGKDNNSYTRPRLWGKKVSSSSKCRQNALPGAPPWQGTFFMWPHNYFVFIAAECAKAKYHFRKVKYLYIYRNYKKKQNCFLFKNMCKNVNKYRGSSSRQICNIQQ